MIILSEWVLNDAKNLGRYFSGAEHTAQGKPELILVVTMETRHPIGDHLVVSEFLASVIIEKLQRPGRKTRNFVSNLCIFFGKMTH